MAAWVPNRDWLKQAVVNDPQCGNYSLTAVSSSYDWLRYYWDMRTDEHLTNAQMIEFVDRMNFRNWNDTGILDDRPMRRSYVAAWQMGLLTSHTNQWNNGQDRW